MSCGICAPELFRPAPNRRVIGYAVGPNIPGKVKKLHFQGCEFVWADQPKGQVRHRPNFKRLLRCLRRNDTLIISSMNALGSRPETQNAKLLQFEERGVNVFEIIPSK